MVFWRGCLSQEMILLCLYCPLVQSSLLCNTCLGLTCRLTLSEQLTAASPPMLDCTCRVCESTAYWADCTYCELLHWLQLTLQPFNPLSCHVDSGSQSQPAEHLRVRLPVSRPFQRGRGCCTAAQVQQVRSWVLYSCTRSASSFMGAVQLHKFSKFIHGCCTAAQVQQVHSWVLYRCTSSASSFMAQPRCCRT